LIDGDTLSRVLHIDLSRRRFWVEERRDLFEKYLGGTGVAISLLREECPKGADPLSPENPIVLAVGPLVGVFPTASKTVAMFKSPHTGNLGESHAGGRSAVAIRMAGYGAIVVEGASATPIYLAIHESKVHFRDASALWGMESSYTVGRIIREREPGAGARTIMRIGRAGERLIPYACVVTETYRHFGRLGLGAVFGSKKLKAVVISGRRPIRVRDPKLYREVYDEIFNSLKSPLMKKYHDLGTPMNVNPLNEIGALPTENLKEPRFKDAENISGETFAEKYLGRRVACAHCPVACIHLASLREPYEAEPYFYKTRMINYDYEPIYSLGSMLGISSTIGLLKLIDEIEMRGLDAISAGVILAWATEAQDRGLISEKETDGLRFSWGDYSTYMRAVKLIVEQPNDFYKALARGVEYASSIYGGAEFALAFGRNEMPGYHTGPAAHVSYLVGSRHSHLDAAGYSLDQKMFKSGEKPTPNAIAEALIAEEQWRQILSSLVVCYFAREVYTPQITVKALNVLGYELSEEDLKKIGAEVLKAKYEFKLREGFDLNKLRIPRRIFETPTPLGTITEGFIKESMNAFRMKIESLPGSKRKGTIKHRENR
jgi:aldehyde:ferredoxin oxidoreductase